MGQTRRARSRRTLALSAGRTDGAGSTWPPPVLATASRSSAASAPATSPKLSPMKGCSTSAATSTSPHSRLTAVEIRQARPSDHLTVISVIDNWWGGAPDGGHAPPAVLRLLHGHLLRGR